VQANVPLAKLVNPTKYNRTSALGATLEVTAMKVRPNANRALTVTTLMPETHLAQLAWLGPLAKEL
jgi:hypothetical protein